jgi:dTDP-4-dehydrorhamnose reductase
MTRVLVTGANGQLGRELERARWPASFEVRPFSRAQLDITRAQAVSELVEQLRPALIVNAAAYTAVDRAEDDSAGAFAVNSTAVAHLAGAAERCRARLLHVSTDYVFDGTRDGWYVEADPINPLGVYGRSKAEGERAALAYPGSTVVRTAWVYGALGPNFVTTMLRLARERKVIGVVADQMGCPTSAKDLAAALVQIGQVALEATLEPRLFHLASPASATWHELAAAVFSASRHGFAGEFRTLTTAEYPTRAKRPANSRLDTTLIHATLGIRLADWHDSVVDVVRELEDSTIASSLGNSSLGNRSS